MVGVEIDMVVCDSVKALELYERVFGAERVEATAYENGLNEAVFTIFGTRFHLLDENAEYQLFAPKDGERKPMWLNVLVPDIKATFEKAIESGFNEIQPITEIPEMGVSNAVCTDPFGYVWMLHQIHREVSFEERTKILEGKLKNK
ncbi:MAG: VOC family protein [Syntrophomonas sp.]